MQREEITADISEDDSPETIQDDVPEDDAPEEDVQEDVPKETSDPDQEEASEPFWKREDMKEVVVKKDTIQKRGEASDEDSSSTDLTEYYSPASELVYSDDVFEQILTEQQTTNALLVRITNQNDLFLGIGVALIICCICYSVLERFTRF